VIKKIHQIDSCLLQRFFLTARQVQRILNRIVILNYILFRLCNYLLLYECIYVFMHLCIYVFMYLCIFMYFYVFFMYFYVFLCIFMYFYVFMYLCSIFMYLCSISYLIFVRTGRAPRFGHVESQPSRTSLHLGGFKISLTPCAPTTRRPVRSIQCRETISPYCKKKRKKNKEK
jgi:hypothetical protein